MPPYDETDFWHEDRQINPNLRRAAWIVMLCIGGGFWAVVIALIAGWM